MYGIPTATIQHDGGTTTVEGYSYIESTEVPAEPERAVRVWYGEPGFDTGSSWELYTSATVMEVDLRE